MGQGFRRVAGALADAVEAVTVPFGAWLPDTMDTNNPGCEEALNIIPRAGGYTPFKTISPLTGLTLPAACRGGIMLQTLNGDIKLYAATDTKLFVRLGSTFSELYDVDYNKSTYYNWKFISFGTNLIALHPEVDPLVQDANTNEDFEKLEGSPPRASTGARVNDFLVLGNLENEPGDVARQPRRVRWNGFNRIDLPWVTDPNVESDFQDMPSEGGDVTSITGREYGTIFQEKMISRMTYTGGETVFQFEVAEEERGSINDATIDIGTQVFFLAEDGFYTWNGVNTTPIGKNAIDKWFYARFNYDARHRMVGSWDPSNDCVMWAFPVGNSTALTELLIYCYTENRWTHAVLTLEYLFTSFDLGLSLDDLHGNLDTGYPISFDDPIFQGGRMRMAGFNAEHAFGPFLGDNLEATMETSEFTGPTGNRFFVNSARPLVDISTPVCSMRAGSRDQLLGGPLAWGAVTAQEPIGECPVIADGRYMRLRVTIPAATAWVHAMGVEVWRKFLGRA